jgi:Ca-activated chloride channel family protein
MDIGQLRFAEPALLWLLAGLAPLLFLWIWQGVRRRSAARHYASGRTVPVNEQLTALGDLWFWLLVLVAMASTIVALARPQTVARVARASGADIVILIDASASMRVADVAPDRWRRATRWVRTFAESLSWRDDRVALGLFAHYAAPQLRLTRDPNALFFFLDHLGEAPPFRLDVDTTWDTNLEAGFYWGMKLLDKNEELYGPSPNGKAFVVLTDGQTWSGNVEQSIEEATQRGVAIFVVGVGTLGGGMIPEPQWPYGIVPPWAEGGPVHSALDRTSLQQVSLAGGGRYFEVDRDVDRVIALQIIREVRNRSVRGLEEQTVDVYWQFLLGAAGMLGLALAFTRERGPLWWQAAGMVVVLVVLVTLTA